MAGLPDPGERERELARIAERLERAGNWLAQDRCRGDRECEAAKWAEIRALEAKRADLLAQRG